MERSQILLQHNHQNKDVHSRGALISALGDLREADLCEIKASLAYIASPCLKKAK